MEYPDQKKYTPQKSTGIVSSQNVNSHVNTTSTILSIEVFDKKLKSCKPVVVLQKLQVSDIAKYTGTFPNQTVSCNLEKLEIQKSENREFPPTLISNEGNEELSKNIDCLKVHQTALTDAKQIKTNDITKSVHKTSNLSNKLSVMNPDEAVFTSDISKLTTEMNISPEHTAEALMDSKHSDASLIISRPIEEALSVSEHLEEATTVSEHSNAALTVPEPSQEAPTVPEYSEEAPTIPEQSDEAPTVDEYSDEASTVLEPCEEAPTVLEPIEKAPAVPEPVQKAPSVPKHCNDLQTVPERTEEVRSISDHNDEAPMVPECGDEAFIVSGNSDETPAVLAPGDEALTASECSDEALIVPEHSDEALTGPEYSDEALAVPEHRNETPTVPEHSDEAPTVHEHSDEAATVFEPCKEAPTVPEPIEKAPTVPEPVQKAPTVPKHCNNFSTVPERTEEARSISDHNDAVLIVPEYGDEALIIFGNSNETPTVLELGDEALSASERTDETLIVPEQSDEALTVSEHSDEAFTVPVHSDEAFTVPEQRNEALTVPEHSNEALTVPELNDDAITGLGESIKAPTVSKHNDETLSIPKPSKGDLSKTEFDDEVQSVTGESEEARSFVVCSNKTRPVSEHTDGAQPVSVHINKAQPVLGNSDEAQPVANDRNQALNASVTDLIDDCLDAGVMTSPEWTEVSLMGSVQTKSTSDDVEQNNEMLMPGISMKKTLVVAEQDDVPQMTEQLAEEMVFTEVFTEQTSLSLLSHDQGKKVLLTNKETCVTPIVCEFNQSMLASERIDVAEVVPGVTAEPVSDSCFTDQTEDSMTDMDLVYQKLRIGQISKTVSETSKTDDASSLLPVNNILAEASNKMNEIGSEQFSRKTSILQASGQLKMSVYSNDYPLKNYLLPKFQEALATIENSGSIDELKRTLLENTHVQQASQTCQNDDRDSFTTIPEEQLSAHCTEETNMTMIDDSVVFDDGPTTKPQIVITESPSTEAQESKSDENFFEKDQVIMNSLNEEEILLDCGQSKDTLLEEPKGKTCIVDYDEEEIEEGCQGTSGEHIQELVKYDISEDDYFEGSDSDNEEENKKLDNLIVTVQTQDFDNTAVHDQSNSSGNCPAEWFESPVSESTKETGESNFANKNLQDDDSQQSKSEHVQVLEGMSSESPESGSQSGFFNHAQHEPDSSSLDAVEPAPYKNIGKNQLQDPNAFEEGAPHFYLVGDDLVSTFAANIATAWSNNITVLTGEKLTLSEVPALLKERVSSQHLNQQQPVYFVCFVGLYNFIQLEARDCMKTDSPKCHCQMVTLPVTSRIDAETQLRSRVGHIKQELAKFVAGEHYLIIPDIQLIDLSRYQKYLDRVHKEVFDHELEHSESAKRISQKIAIDLVGIIVYLNGIIRDSYAFVDKKLPWLLSLWQIEKPLNRNKLRQIPVTNGYLLTDSATKIVTDCITELLDEYTKPDVPTSLERVYFIGDPRLSTLTPHWPVNGVEIVTINDGNLVPGMVVQTIKNKCKNLERCLIVICFSIKSHVIIKSISSCEGHDPCKYIVYQDTNEREVEEKALDMIETICTDLMNSSLTCEVALSPLLPVNYFKYRSIIEMRHLKNTGHSITGQLPDPDTSNKETCRMARDIDITRSVLTTEMKQRDFSVLDIPGCILESDVICSTAQLVNGMSLTTDMAQKIVGIAVALISLLNNMREERKITSKLAKYKLLRDSFGNSLNPIGAEPSSVGDHPDQSRVEDLTNKIRGVSQPLKSLHTVNNETEPSKIQLELRQSGRYGSSFTNHSSVSSKLLSRLGGISHSLLSPKRGKSRSPRRNELRLAPRRDRLYGRDRTPSPKRKRSRSPQRHKHWSPKRVRSRSPRRDRSFSPQETRDRYSKRGRSRSKSIDRQSRNKRSFSRSSRHDCNRHPKRERSKSSSRSHPRQRRKKLSSSSRISGLQVVSKKEFSKIYEKHVLSFQPFLSKPETHPDYKNWLKTQVITASHGPSYALRVKLNWERRMNELMNIAWKNIKKRYSVKPKNERHSSSDLSSSASSSSASSSSSDHGTKKKRSTKRKKSERFVSEAASLKLRDAALNKEDARKSTSASTSSLSALVNEYFSQLPSQPSTSKDAEASYKEISQSKSDNINWTSKSFVEVPRKHDREPSTQLADTSYIPRSSEGAPNYLSLSVYQPSPSYSSTLDYADHAPPIQYSRCRPFEPEVSSTSDRTSAKTLKVVEILKLLVQVKGKAGVVGETLPLVLNRVQSALDRGIRELACFNSDDVILLGLIKNRLSQTSQEPHVSFIEKVIIDEAVSQLETLLEMVQDALDDATTFFDINVLSRVTEKFSISESMTYIKNLLGEFKRLNSEDDVLPVFVELVKLRGAL